MSETDWLRAHEAWTNRALAAEAEVERLRLDLCFCREAMRHADIDLSMILPDVGPEMQKEFRKTLARLDEAKVRSLSPSEGTKTP